jgi:hypothetical protein
MSAEDLKAACEACYDAHVGDCSGFARAVAQQLGVTLAGLADQIVGVLRAGQDGWTLLPNGTAAAAAAAAGQLVIGGLKGSEQAHPDAHGHVVVVVEGPLAHNAYPTAYWGSLGGNPAKDKTINWAWTAADRDKVSYAAHDIAG